MLRRRISSFVLPALLLGSLVEPLEGQRTRSYSPDLPGEVPVAGPEEGGPRYWTVFVSGELNLRGGPSTETDIVGTFEPETLLDNLGCAAVGGRTWCEVQEFGGGPTGFVAATFLRPATSPDGLIWAGVDRSALRVDVRDFDERGNVACGADGDRSAECFFGASRSGGGDATVQLIRVEGGSVSIFFKRGVPFGTDLSAADGGPVFNSERDGEAHLVTIGGAGYLIPDSIVFGT